MSIACFCVLMFLFLIPSSNCLQSSLHLSMTKVLFYSFSCLEFSLHLVLIPSFNCLQLTLYLSMLKFTFLIYSSNFLQCSLQLSMPKVLTYFNLFSPPIAPSSQFQPRNSPCYYVTCVISN